MWQLYSTLHRQRHYHYGPQPIALADIEAALRLFGYRDPDYLQELVVLLTDMDATWLKWYKDSLDAEEERKADADSRVRSEGGEGKAGRR